MCRAVNCIVPNCICEPGRGKEKGDENVSIKIAITNQPLIKAQR